MLSIIPGHASIANQVFAKFISRLPHIPSELAPPETPKRERMKKALSILADIVGDGSIASRDPLSSLSFCCLSPEIVKSQTDTLVQRRKGLNCVFSPLGPEGRPLRRCVTCYLLFPDFNLLPDIPTGKRITGFIARRTDCPLRVNLLWIVYRFTILMALTVRDSFSSPRARR